MTSVAVTDTTQTVVITEGDGIVVATAASQSVIVETVGIGPQGPQGAGGALAHYANIIDTTSQALASTSAAQAVALNTTLESSGITVNNGSRINFSSAGTYKVLASLQITNSANSIAEVNIFFKKNGNTFADSNTRIDLEPRKSIGVPYHDCFTIEYQLTLAASDYIQLFWSADHIDVKLDTIASSALHPQAPSAIVNVAQVMFAAINGASLSGLSDVDESAKVDGSLLYYDAASSKFLADAVNTRITLTDGGNF